MMVIGVGEVALGRGTGVVVAAGLGDLGKEEGMEATDFLCTVTIARVMPDQAWWFWSCSKCHRSTTAYGAEYRCSGGCVSSRAYPKYRLCLVGTDGTGTAEFVFFNRVAQRLVGKSVVPLLKSSGVPREIAAVVLQKYTLVVSVTEKSLTQRNISFQSNGIEAFLGKQTCLPNDTRTAPVMPLGSGISQTVVEASSASASKADGIPQLPIVPAGSSRRAAISRVPLGSTKRKEADSVASGMEEKEPEGGAPLSDGNIEMVPQDLNNMPAGLTELSAEAVTPVGPAELQAMEPVRRDTCTHLSLQLMLPMMVLLFHLRPLQRKAMHNINCHYCF